MPKIRRKALRTKKQEGEAPKGRTPSWETREKMSTTQRARRAAERDDPVKTCLNCGVVLVRKRNESGVLEGNRDFRKRKFCGYQCANTYNR
jgi:hypothetical protein